RLNVICSVICVGPTDGPTSVPWSPGPVGNCLANHAKWLSLYVYGPTCCHTPMQKFPSCGGRMEFMISVPSLCHTTRASSITAPGGATGGAAVSAVNVTCHIPTMDALHPDSSSFNRLPENAWLSPICGCQLAGFTSLVGRPHCATAPGIVPKAIAA